MPFQNLLSGLYAASTGLNTTANNIANVSTDGFRVSRVEYADVAPTGNGVRVSRISQEQSQGLQATDDGSRPSDVVLTEQLINMIKYSRQIEAHVSAMRTTIATEKSVADMLRR